MARKGCNEKDILRLLREIEVSLQGGIDVITACRIAGISDKTFFGWRKRYSRMGRANLWSSRHWKKKTSGSKRFWKSFNRIS